MDALKRLSKVIMAIGAIIALLAVCCLDSPGVYGYFSGVVAILGGFITGAGYAVRMIGDHLEEKQKAYFYEIKRSDRLDADVEFIDLNENSTHDSLARTGAIQ